MNSEALDREEFEARMLMDKDFFSDYAWKFMGTPEGYNRGLLEWSWIRYQAERTPAFTRGWEK